MAIQYAIDKKLPERDAVHKGNIMKFTEGAFKDWGYELAKAEFRDQIVTEDEVYKDHGGKTPAGKVLIKDRIADSMFQQIQLRPDEYSVIATPNLNGDYLSDAAAALTGGIGLAAGANIGDKAAMFEATHGTAPKYTGKNMANPGAVLLSGVLLLEYLGWFEAAKLVNKARRGDVRRERGDRPRRARAASCTSPTTSPGSSPATARRPGRPAPSSPTGSSTTWGRSSPMTRRYVDQLRDGDNLDEVYLVTDKQLRANRNGNPYLQLELRDRTGGISGPAVERRRERRPRRSTPATSSTPTGKVQLFQGALQVILDHRRARRSRRRSSSPTSCRTPSRASRS